MKISPVVPGAAPVHAEQAPQLSPRRITMATNASPERFNPVPPEAQATPPPPTTQAPASESAISDGSEAGEVEANRPLSPQFAAIAKAKRALQVKERELQEREKALQAAPKEGVIDVARLKSEPLSVLLENGVTYDDLTKAILANPNGGNPELQALKAEIAALKDGVDKRLSDRDAQAEQQVLAEMRREAERLAAEGDAYEMVRETKSIPDVMTLIERTYKERGEVLDVAEALQLVEAELVKESLRIARTKKVQSQLAPPPAAPPPNAAQAKPPMRTLTNRDTAQPAISRRARAIAAFHNSQAK